jgi:hypothetical protein
MTISGNYPSPVTVNGYSCRNCTDVDYAKKHIDPAHPKAGPFGMNDPGGKASSDGRPVDRKAALAADRLHPVSYTPSTAMAGSNAIGTLVDVAG